MSDSISDTTTREERLLRMFEHATDLWQYLEDRYDLNEVVETECINGATYEWTRREELWSTADCIREALKTELAITRYEAMTPEERVEHDRKMDAMIAENPRRLGFQAVKP